MKCRKERNWRIDNQPFIYENIPNNFHSLFFYLAKVKRNAEMKFKRNELKSKLKLKGKDEKNFFWI